jgi:hypothetical protein
MSKTSDKKARRRIEQAEFIWNRDQLIAAGAYKVLEEAILNFEEHKKDLTDEQIKATEDQIEVQKESIKQFVLQARDMYVERTRGDVRVDESALTKE